MKLSIFVTVTNPMIRGDNYIDALRCYKDLADEVVIVDGNDFGSVGERGYDNVRRIYYEWPTEFDWPLIGQQFQRGYEACTGDWVIHADLDFIFHQRDFAKIRQQLKEFPNVPALSFYKWQFIIPDRYNLKSRLPLAVNKAHFGERIRFDSGGDLCQPSLDGQEIKTDDIPETGVAFYNYEHMLKTRAQITDDVSRMDRAYQRHFGKWLYSEDGTEKSAFEGWMRMMQGRFERPSQRIPLEQHPKYVQRTIQNLRPGQFGYSGFGKLGTNNYA